MKGQTLIRQLNTKNYQAFSVVNVNSGIYKKIIDIIPSRVQELKEMKARNGENIIGTYTLNQVIGGMRGIQGLFQDISRVEPHGGVFIREQLQKAIKDGEPLPEACYWLLNSGEIPFKQQTNSVIKEWQCKYQNITNIIERGELSDEVISFILKLPKELSSTNMLSQVVLYLQRDSIFHKAYDTGIAKKGNYWQFYHEDSMNLIAKLPRLAAIVYRHKYHNDNIIAADNDLDWAGNYAHMLGFETETMREYMRGFMTTHSEHEGGSISAHTTHLVSSALSDPYLCFSAGVNAIGGHKYGLANHEVLKWMMQLKSTYGGKKSVQDITDENIIQFVKDWFKTKKGLAGYGHPVLNETDSRYFQQKAFGQKYLAHDPLVQLCNKCSEVIPEWLAEEHKEFRNPHPNVDAYSGILLYSLGLTQHEYYNTIFAVSRSLGNLTWLTWARAYGLPLERPNSFDKQWLENKFK